ncbi:MAG: ATP-binding protein [Chlamydiae bacterium]|nr:ATP-binding protein [Chlamydiota bacterium]MBI3266901.1 ATP-binding protein [Chlamydiota bacterium]
MFIRYLEKAILETLPNKMVFISGPRQVGKTTLAREIGNRLYHNSHAYLNWDYIEDRRIISKGLLPTDKKLFIFDEIHKYKNWKNYLKGQYDKYKDTFRILVTGSARLDIYRRGGDSLLGRYYSYRLHPLSVHELSKEDVHVTPMKELHFIERNEQEKIFEMLLKFGGFPEVFFKQNEKNLRLWHHQRIDRLVKEDIRDVENLRDISALQILVDILPEKVGSLFSLNSLREDFNVAYKTIALWMEVLEKFYYHFRIYPYQNTLIKSLRKEPKLYLWDWSQVKNENARLENMVASHLLKFVHYLSDVEGFKTQLSYLRDKEQREVDFMVSLDGKPWFCVEVKQSSTEVPSSLKYFASKLKIPFVYQVTGEKDFDFMKDNVRIISASKFLSALV